ncbi:hypothetical protein [Thiorhodococcus fuscus]|uniref:DUF4340 domain-containing protein n=1 Tax=Thiorhodococcus fuscus TaxID=527200 RepID=A0ABW4Y961_9GAMM
MKGRWLVNLILALAVIALGIRVHDELTRTESGSRLTDLDASNLQLIEIARDGDPLIRLGRSGHGWRMEAPLQVDAEPAQVERLLGLLSTPVYRSFPEDAAALGELGLDTTRLRLRLDTLELAFGGIDPLGQHRYVSADGIVSLINDQFYPALIAPVTAYVSRRLLPRGFAPVFGRIAGVPLAAKALSDVDSLTAERVEPLPASFNGMPVELEAADGDALNFQVSPDRRLWARPDQHLLYILGSAPDLPENPTAVDPTPASPETSLDDFGPEDEMPIDPEEVFAPLQEDDDPVMPIPKSEGLYAPTADPDAIVPGDIELGAPPEVRLTPHGEAPPVVRPRPRARGLSSPGSAADYGIGQDPFAPDPQVEQ